MSRYEGLAPTNGKSRHGTPRAAVHEAINQVDAASDSWPSDDRPVYECAKCGELAMQFYARHPVLRDQRDVFYCHACGATWVI